MKAYQRLTFFVVAILSICCVFCGDFAQQTSVVLANAQDLKLPIIMYHCTSPKVRGAYNVPPSLLGSDFAYILKQGYTPVFLQQVVDFYESGKALPDKPIVITFDDAYHNNFVYALPIIKKYGVKTVYSIVGKYTDDNYKGSLLKPTHSHMHYGQIIEMIDSGLVELSNHTYNLHNKKGKRFGAGKLRTESDDQYKAMLQSDLQQLQNSLKDKVGIAPTVVTYPFGKYNDLAKQTVKQMGFKAALVCTQDINILDNKLDLYELKRFNRTPKLCSQAYFDKIFSKIDSK